MPVGILSANLVSRLRAALCADSGSSVIEFVLVFPVVLVMILLAFSDTHAVQMRQLGVTLMARELGRGIEIGRTPTEIAQALSLLCDDLGFGDEPRLLLVKTDQDTAMLTVSYKGETHSSNLTLKNSNPLWKQLQPELGSSLPLLVALVGLVVGISCLSMNLSATRIAYVRANDLASSLAISVAGSGDAVLTETAEVTARDWPIEIQSRVKFRVQSPDQKTSDVRLCYEYQEIWEWLAPSRQQACAERKARLLPP
jgi:hypothetical protein